MMQLQTNANMDTLKVDNKQEIKKHKPFPQEFKDQVVGVYKSGVYSSI